MSEQDIAEQLRGLAELLSPENTDSEADLHLICEAAAGVIDTLRKDQKYLLSVNEDLRNQIEAARAEIDQLWAGSLISRMKEE